MKTLASLVLGLFLWVSVPSQAAKPASFACSTKADTNNGGALNGRTQQALKIQPQDSQYLMVWKTRDKGAVKIIRQQLTSVDAKGFDLSKLNLPEDSLLTLTTTIDTKVCSEPFLAGKMPLFYCNQDGGNGAPQTVTVSDEKGNETTGNIFVSFDSKMTSSINSRRATESTYSANLWLGTWAVGLNFGLDGNGALGDDTCDVK